MMCGNMHSYTGRASPADALSASTAPTISLSEAAARLGSSRVAVGSDALLTGFEV